MFAIAFDLVVADTAKNHPKGVAQGWSRRAIRLRWCAMNFKQKD